MIPEVYPVTRLAVFGSEASEIILTVAWPSRVSVADRSSGKIITAFIFPFLNVASIPSYESSRLLTVKKSDASSLWIRSLETLSRALSRTAIEAFFRSVLTAYPKMSNCDAGIPKRITSVRTSRKMWRNSLRTNAMNLLMR